MSEKVPGRVIVSAMALILGVIAGHSLGIGGDGYPTLSSPYPVFLVVPAFLGVPAVLLAIGFGLVFAAWSIQLLRSEATIPRRSIILFVIATILSSLVYFSGWQYGLKYQGESYVFAALATSVIIIVVLVVLAGFNRRKPSLATSAAFHFVLFAWLATYAMPYLGETP